VLAEAAENYAPSLIAQFTYDLAKEFNRFYTEEPILKEPDENYRKFKLAFAAMVARAIHKTMEMLGINVPERM
jgi:arginyl-tRNA synthetase